MNRRRVLAALGGLTLAGGGLWAARGGFSGTDGSGLPVRVETLDAPGSSAGHVRVPVPETVTVVDLFATWCAPCVEQMEALASAHETHGDDAVFVSVTNERPGGALTRADLREWWRRHGGAWTIGLDPESDLMAALGASGLPYLAVADGTGTVVWEHDGVADAARIREAIEEAG